MPTLYALFVWLARRAPLLRVRDADAEIEKLAFVRILVGIVVLVRILPIVYGSYFYFNDALFEVLPAATIAGVAVVALVVCVTIGLFTPIALVGTLLLYGSFDRLSHTQTLGTQILTLLLTLLLLTGAGSRRSLDAGLMQRGGTLGRFVRRLYALPGRLDEDAVTVSYLLIFMSYAVISLGAILLHIHDSYWRQGYTLQVMLTSSYLSRAYELFRGIEAVAPGVLRAFSIVAGAGQAIFQLLMPLLIFARGSGWFVVIWGMNFFLASTFLLELSYLPYIEILLWAALFFRAPRRHALAIYYDDYCNLCKRTVQTLRTVDFAAALDFRPASTSGAEAERHGIDVNALSTSLHGVYRDRVYAGYDLYLLITRRAPLLWVFAPILWILRVLRVGPMIYEAVARNRRRMFGTCEVAYDVRRRYASRPTLRPSPVLGPALGVVCGVYVALFYGTLFLRLPDLDSGIPRAAEGIYRLGFEVPNVFNSTDLRMSDHWRVVYRQSADGGWDLVPFHAPDGRKLLYPRVVDILYFGNSLPWRRLALEQDIIAFTRGAIGDSLVRRLIEFDERIRNERGGRYRIDVYRNFASAPGRKDRAKYDPQLLYSYQVDRSEIRQAGRATESAPAR